MNSVWGFRMVVIFVLLVVCDGVSIFAQNAQLPKKRDPFVALVNSNGKIKTKDELFPVLQRKAVTLNVALTAIIWDEKRPLAMVNGKIYSEGSMIGGVEGLILERIYPNSILINENGNIETIPLRKVLKNQ